MTTRLFLAHPKSMEDAEIEAMGLFVHASFESEKDDIEPPTVIPGRDDYQQYAPSAGNFHTWAKSVAERMDTESGERFYAAFVATDRFVGSATATILRVALSLKIPVFVVLDYGSPKSRIEPVRDVITIDSKNYTSGWQLDC